MKYDVLFEFSQRFLPTKRHRVPRERKMVTVRQVGFQEVASENFPIAFVVHDQASVYRGFTNVYEFREAMSNNREVESDGKIRYEFCDYPEEIRMYGGKLYKVMRETWGAAIADGLYISPHDVARGIGKAVSNGWYINNQSELFNKDASVILEDNLGQLVGRAQERADEYVMYDGKLWEECEEPMYVIHTFGLGHNHAGIGVSLDVEYYYNPNISRDSYFDALHLEQAKAKAHALADRRGDTNSHKYIGDEWIDVRMPEAVKRDPKAEHGDGDPFLSCTIAETASA